MHGISDCNHFFILFHPRAYLGPRARLRPSKNVAEVRGACGDEARRFRGEAAERAGRKRTFSLWRPRQVTEAKCCMHRQADAPSRIEGIARGRRP